MNPASPDRPQVVIVGSGFGGLFAARKLGRAPVDVTVVDRTNHHLFQPLLYQVATGILSSGEIAPPTRDILRRNRNTTVLQGEAVRLDDEAGTLTVETAAGGTRELRYDYLIAATGASTSYFGHAEFEANTLAMKSLSDSLTLRAQIFKVFEEAEWVEDPAERRRLLTFALIGAGPTGVELAGQIGELAHRSLRGNFRNFDPRTETRVVLLDATPRILGAYTPRQSRLAARALERLGVELRMDAMVTSIDENGLTYRHGEAEERLEAATRVWAAGVQASGFAGLLAEATGAPTDRAGRILVEPDCSVPGHPRIFAVGDMMALDDLPGLAEVAMQSGRHAAKLIRATTRDQRRGRPPVPAAPRKPFHYHDLGSMAAVSRTNAVASFRGLHFTGLVGWAMWLGVHLFFLTGFKNRVTTVIHWAVTFLGRARSQRAYTQEHVERATRPGS